MATTYRVLVLPGDHVGPEVMVEALKVFQIIAEHASTTQNVKFELVHEIAGGCSIDKHGVPITEDVLKIAEGSDAVLFGSVGGPKWGTKQPNPESGLLKLREHLGGELLCLRPAILPLAVYMFDETDDSTIIAFANIRPCVFYSQSLIPLSPLKPEIVTGTNFIILRENCGGAYYGPKHEDDNTASDTWQYSRPEIERSTRVAAALARTFGADGKGLSNGPPATVWSADKANVLANSRLWRRVTTEILTQEFPDIELKHQLADSLSLMMMKNPKLFNGIIHTDNTFGDMLSDQAGGVVGTLGTLPSASICGIPGEGLRCNGIYEPVHGSAPDIAGKGIVNPVAQILSMAMMLRYSFGMQTEARAVEAAVEKVLDGKDRGGLEIRTGDLGGKYNTVQVGDAVCEVLRGMLKQPQQGANGHAH